MRDPSLEPYRIQMLKLLSKNLSTPFHDCLEVMNETLSNFDAKFDHQFGANASGTRMSGIPPFIANFDRERT